MPQRRFTPFRTVLVPIVFGCEAQTALTLAARLAPEVVLIGLVKVEAGASLSAGVGPAQAIRKRLRQLTQAGHKHIRSKAQVLVSSTPWQDLLAVVAAEKPDLLLLEWGCQVAALGVTPAEALMHPPCNMALVRGPLPQQLEQVLIPLRGGSHAELALRVGLSLQPCELVTLHLKPGDSSAQADAPFQGLERVLKRLPEVQARTAIAPDAGQAILAASRRCNLIVLGANTQSLQATHGLGAVADRLLQEATAPVMVVATRHPLPVATNGVRAGVQAISILVDKWFAENTFQAAEFADLQHLLALKQTQGVTISLALPALNEEATVGKVLRTLKSALMDKTPLLDEIVLIDSNSTDHTRAIAQKLEVPVHIHQSLLPALGTRHGKGEALWKSLLVTHGDIVVWIDTDIVNIHPRFVYGVLGPLLLDPRIQFVKGFYRRPLRVGDKVQAGGGGRVTELTARPLLNLFYPELSGIVQPLSGEYAGRRAALEQLPFFSGYGVEIGLLIDVFDKYGLPAIAQVDLLERIHHNQSLAALSKMSFAILQAVFHKLAQRHGHPFLEEVNKSMKLIRDDRGGYALDVEEIVEQERPPMLSVAEYHQRRLVPARRRPAAVYPAIFHSELV